MGYMEKYNKRNEMKSFWLVMLLAAYLHNWPISSSKVTKTPTQL